MGEKLNQSIDALSEFLAHRKGLLVIVGILLVVINAILQFFPGIGWLATSNLLLHLGIIVSLVGVMVAWSL